MWSIKKIIAIWLYGDKDKGMKKTWAAKNTVCKQIVGYISAFHLSKEPHRANLFYSLSLSLWLSSSKAVMKNFNFEKKNTKGNKLIREIDEKQFLFYEKKFIAFHFFCFLASFFEKRNKKNFIKSERWIWSFIELHTSGVFEFFF